MAAVDAESWSKSHMSRCFKSSLIDALMPVGVLNTLASTSSHKYDSHGRSQAHSSGDIISMNCVVFNAVVSIAN